MTYVIFDLDGTVIDSSHRHLSKPDGSVDLVHWRENCTPEKIFQDSLLPLANEMREVARRGHFVIICTARIFTQADFDFLDHHNLFYNVILSRGENDNRGDGEMKTAMLNELAQLFGYDCVGDMNAIMYDDNLKVIKAMLDARVTCFDATKINRRLAG
jgi:hypothetical protein